MYLGMSRAQEYTFRTCSLAKGIPFRRFDLVTIKPRSSNGLAKGIIFDNICRGNGHVLVKLSKEAVELEISS